MKPLTFLGQTVEPRTSPESYSGPGIHVTVRHLDDPPEWDFAFENPNLRVTLSANGHYDVSLDYSAEGDLSYEGDYYDEDNFPSTEEMAGILEDRIVRLAREITSKSNRNLLKNLRSMQQRPGMWFLPETDQIVQFVAFMEGYEMGRGGERFGQKLSAHLKRGPVAATSKDVTLEDALDFAIKLYEG